MKTSEHQEKLLQKVRPVEKVNILRELEKVSEDFWDEYGKYSITCVSPGMINKEGILTVLVSKPEDANSLPVTFKTYRVIIEYGDIE